MDQVMARERLHKPFGICPCTSFGRDREQHFPHYWFCDQCSLWDIEAGANNLSQISSVSRAYKCKAKHKLHSMFPTHPKQVHYTLRGKKDEEEAFSDHAEDDASVDEDSTNEEQDQDYNDAELLYCQEEDPLVSPFDDVCFDLQSSDIGTENILPAKRKICEVSDNNVEDSDARIGEECNVPHPSTPAVHYVEVVEVGV